MLIPSLFAVFLAYSANEPSVWISTLTVIGLNTWYAYHASILQPRRFKIVINNEILQLNSNDEFCIATIEEQYWFGAHWGLLRLITEQQQSFLIFLSPLTVNNGEELRRFKVHATHNKHLSQATIDDPA